MRILIVGAGAVGQVYAYCLKRAGHTVFFYAKEKYAEALRQDQYLYPLNRKNARKAPQTFKVDGVLTAPDELGGQCFDQIYLCMSSTGLRGPWIEAFSRATGESTIVALQPTPSDLEFLKKYFPEERIVSGMITLISYHAPLPGEVTPGPGMAFWFPPMSATPFSGEGKRVKEVVDALNAGGHPSREARDVPSMAAFPAAMLMCLIAGLEIEDWKFEQLSGSKTLDVACQAIKEAASIVGNAPFLARFISPWMIRVIMKISPHVIPMDIETYLRVHFTKVGDQTRLYLKEIVERGEKQGQAVEQLQRLKGAL